eukprot:TRINITY_DN10400_c2_g2_i1.p1 TRINITY_DN10400_c2_g2~~TRINITY_DN10400_c2_g2_i1.p1  ORF type:complete len:1088 (+),score=402.15 TRINITY_DN10400_c2_g2_i1:65-3328(+)
MTAVEVEVPASMLEGKPKVHKYITLENGLDVLLISDETTEQSAAAMDCGVGQFHDPEDLPGLAHFTEHMMFLGTEKYPQENSYNSYLTEHGGMCNAYTSYENTNYIFNVVSSALEGALDRFAQFFISPLFTESATERELMAVESENQRFLTEDYMRFIMFLKDLVSPSHPFCNFGCGDMESLRTVPTSKGINVRSHLFEFQKYYTSRAMKLCVYGKEDVATLQEMVTRMFSAIPDKGPVKDTHPWTDVHPFDKTKLGKLYYVNAVNENTRLHMFWAVKGGYGLYKTKPTRYIAHITGHECEGSLLWVLKKKNWATELLAGSVLDMSKTYTLFELEIYLTTEGYEHLFDVIGLVYQHFALVRKAGFCEEVWKEVRDTAAMEFSYGDMPSPYRHTSHCAACMLKYEPVHTLSGDYKIFEKDEKAIVDLLQEFVPDNAIMAVKRPNFEEAVVLDRTSRFYGNKYGVRELSAEELEAWREPKEICGDLTMPRINPFIPDDFVLVENDGDGYLYPQVVLRSEVKTHCEGDEVGEGLPEVEVYHWKDNVYKVPKVSMRIKVTSPVAYSSPKCRVLNRILVKILKEQTNTVTYYASIANLNLDILSSIDGLELHTSGLSQKIPKLLEEVWVEIARIAPTRELFGTSLEKVTEDLLNFNRKQAVMHSSELLGMVTHFTRWTVREVLETIKTVTYEDMMWFIEEFRKNVKLTVLAIGNITKKDTLMLTRKFREWYLDKCGPLPYSLFPQHSRILKLPKGKNLVIPLQGYNPENISTVVGMYFQFGMQTPWLVSMVDILARLLDSLFFNALRTSEQLGYVVGAYPKPEELVEGFKLVVQSAVCSPWYAFSRMWCFVEALDQWVDDISEEDFASVVNAEIQRRKDLPKTLNKQMDIWWKSIENRRMDFNHHLYEIQELEGVKKEHFVKFFKKHVSNHSEERRMLVSFVFGKNHQDEMERITREWRGWGRKPTFTEERRPDVKVDLVKTDDVPDVVIPDEVLEAIMAGSLPPAVMSHLTDAGITPDTIKEQGATPELIKVLAPLLDLPPKDPKPAQTLDKESHLSSITLPDGADLPAIPLTYVMSHGEFKMTMSAYPAW